MMGPEQRYRWAKGDAGTPAEMHKNGKLIPLLFRHKAYPTQPHGYQTWGNTMVFDEHGQRLLKKFKVVFGMVKAPSRLSLQSISVLLSVIPRIEQ